MEQAAKNLLARGLEPLYSFGMDFYGNPLILVTDPEGFRTILTNDSKFPKCVMEAAKEFIGWFDNL